MSEPKKKEEEKPKYYFEVKEDGSLIMGRIRNPKVTMEIPPKLYSLNFHPEVGFILKPEESFKLPPKVYGPVDDNIDRFFKSFEAEDKNLGVILLGAKGSGKTITLKKVAKRANELTMPVILVNDAHGGDHFVNFLNAIPQPIVVAFDELDKSYTDRGINGGLQPSKAQDTILRVLDGASTGNKKFFIFTANEQEQLSPYLFNRPSRIRYHVQYELHPTTVTEYLAEHLQDKSEPVVRSFMHLLRLRKITYGQSSAHLNFDMMVELVKEMNRFGDNLDKAYNVMFSNKDPFAVFYELRRYKNGVLVESDIPAQCMIETTVPLRFDVAKDAIKINADITREVTDEEKKEDAEKPQYARRRNMRVPLLLSSENFDRYGDDFDTLHFVKDGFEYVVKYSDQQTYNWLTSRQNRADRYEPGGGWEPNDYNLRHKQYHRPE